TRLIRQTRELRLCICGVRARVPLGQRNQSKTRMKVTAEIHAPAVRSQVLTNRICTRFSPACTGISIWPVLLRTEAATGCPLTSTFHAGQGNNFKANWSANDTWAVNSFAAAFQRRI